VTLEIGRGINDDISTNAAGEFEFKELAPGSYVLIAKPPAKVRVQDGVRLGTVTIYYPSGTEPSQAVPIPVRAGEDVSGIEVRLKSVPVHRISGVILDPAGMPVAKATVKLLGRAPGTRQSLMSTPILTVRPSDLRPDAVLLARSAGRAGPAGSITTVGPSPEPVIAAVESRQDGGFEFPAVESGEWRVSAVADLYEGTPIGNVVSAFVGEKDVEDLRVRLAGAIAVRGTAAFDGLNPPALLGGAPTLQPMEAQEHVYFTQPGIAGKRPGDLAGRYRVMSESAIQLQDLYVASILWQGRDVLGQVVELGPGAEPFQIVYKSGLGGVGGTVDHGAGALVLLIPRTQREIVDVLSIQCDAGGAFSLSNVPPGDYGIVAFDRGELVQVQWAALESVVVPMTESLHLDAGSATNLNPRVSGWPW